MPWSLSTLFFKEEIVRIPLSLLDQAICLLWQEVTAVAAVVLFMSEFVTLVLNIELIPAL